ncbi:MAG TPA: thioredoxin [Treponema sp.]|nr:thioredoxin [Treponema sp.]
MKKTEPAERNLILGFVQGAVIIAAVLCMIYGIRRGELRPLVNKAIRICMECIGLG